MRPEVDGARVEQLLAALGRRVRAPHTLYLIGGSSAVLVGCRASTRDIDLRPEPGSDELLRALRDLKDTLDLNSVTELRDGFDAMRTGLFRFPAVDVPASSAGYPRSSARRRELGRYRSRWHAAGRS